MVDKHVTTRFHAFDIRLVMVRSLAAAVCLCAGCDETLPPYVSPADVFETTLTHQVDEYIEYSHMDFNDSRYPPVTFISPPLILNVGITNTFDETLEDVAGIEGRIDLWMEGRPEARTSVPLNLTTINSDLYDPVSKILSLDAGQTFWLKAFWRYQFDDGYFAFAKTKVQREERYDPWGHFYRFHEPLQLKARVMVTLFSRLAPARSREFELTLVFKGRIISPP